MKNKNNLSKSKKNKKCDISLNRLPADLPWKMMRWITTDLRDNLADSDFTSIDSIIRSRDLDAYMELSEDWTTQCIQSSDISMAERRAKYLVASYLKKFQFPGDSAARKAVALEKFYSSEIACGSYNQVGYKQLVWAKDHDTACKFTYMQAYLSKLLGDVPQFEDLTEWSRHGPGATLDTRKGLVSSYFKYAEWPYSCTEAALGYGIAAIKNDKRWLGALEDSYRRVNSIPPQLILDQAIFWQNVIKIVPGNRITFVPKNSRTDRSIAIEPTLNLYLQLGIDGYIRSRLKRWNIDLDDQSRNQEMARLGSIDGSFATLDLSSASDTISKALLKYLLTPDWFNLLIRLASPVGQLDSEEIRYNKISSMGNGFTFALESAVFSAAVFAVQRHRFGKILPHTSSVYGDDIIVTTEICEEVIDLLTKMGFTINQEKSFVSGPFRESCGSDWYQGVNVRPVYLKQQPSNVKDLYVIYNSLHRFLTMRYSQHVIKEVKNCLKWIPDAYKHYGPLSDDNFDSYIHSDTPQFASYNLGMWVYPRLISMAPSVPRCHSFLFRKLMHSLRAGGDPKNNWDPKCSSGSRFSVTWRKPGDVRRKFSRTSTWCDEYAVIINKR
jgi:hypothetical protein